MINSIFVKYGSDFLKIGRKLNLKCLSTNVLNHETNKALLLRRLSLSSYHRRYSSKKQDENMVRVLNVAEKNDAAKSIADIMSRGGFRRREGFSVYNKIYEFETMINGSRCLMTMTSVSGHLLNKAFTGQYKKWYGCNPIELFDAPVVKHCEENMLPIKRTLEREAKNASRLIVWTDCDREGENIGFEVISVCTDANPNLQVHRAKFSEITFQSVNRALNNLAQPDENQNNAVDVRSELDLRIGAAFTRFQTLRLQKVFPQTLSDTLISYGSCQFPTLGFVVERYKAIESFIPEQFWKLKMMDCKDNCSVEFRWGRVRLFEETPCQVILEKCLENLKAFVKSVKSKTKSKWRPLPLDTVELEKLCSRKLRINAKETMKIAEKLYTRGFISYPRTETNIFPKELDLRPLVQNQVENHLWQDFANRILEKGPNPRQGKKTDQAHPPIHPLKHASNLAGDEFKIYEFITRHFLACLSDDAKGTETVVLCDVNGEEFTASGLIILERNYLDVYPYDKWSDKEMPNYQEGESFEPTSLEMLSSETTPPALLTEADLIALMEKHGIGTDATHAEHIETIKSRMYVGLQDARFFVPGELGMGLVEGYDSMGFEMSKPHLRAGLEADLKAICEGRKDPAVVLRDQINNYKTVFTEALTQAAKIDVALDKYLNENATQTNNRDALPQSATDMKIQKCTCGSYAVLKTKKDNKGVYIGCQGFPDCKNVLWFPDTVLQVDVTDRTCEQCTGAPKILKFKFSPRAYAPYLPTTYETCIGGCDSFFMDTLDIRNPFSRRVNCNGPPSNRDSGYSSNQSLNNSRNSSFSSQNQNSRNSNFGSQNNHNANLGNSSSNFGNPRNSSTSNSNARFKGPENLNMQDPNSTGIPGSGTSIRPNHSKNKRIILSNKINSTPNNNISSTLSSNNKSKPNSRNFSTSSNIESNSVNIPWNSTNSGFPNTSIENSHNSGFPNNSISGIQNSRFPNNSIGSSQNSRFPNNSIISSQNSRFPNNSIISSQNSRFPNNSIGNSQNSRFPNNSSKGSQKVGLLNTSVGSSQNSRFPNNSIGSSQNSEYPNTSLGSSENAIVCNCNKDALILTVRKDGPNKGRQFYKCPQSMGQGCSFFLWFDDGAQTNRTAGNNLISARNCTNTGFNSNSTTDNSSSSNRSTSNSSYNALENSGTIECNCGYEAKKLTVMKDGPNHGRPFYKCPHPPGKGCSFFSWADDSANSTTNNNTWNDSFNNSDTLRTNNDNSWSNGNSNAGTSRDISRGTGWSSNNSLGTSWSNNDNGSSSWSNNNTSRSNDNFSDFEKENSVKCNCGSPAKLLTTVKEGPNKGRQFYVCCKIREEQCGYFQWADEIGPQNPRPGPTTSLGPPTVLRGRGRGSRGSGRGSASGVKKRGSEQGDDSAKRKCSLCSELGHDRRNCPYK